jgi:hypothetical protein
MELSSPALFDAINARFLEPAQVGRNFILPTAQFRIVTQNNNTILIGPRGSGKTTLLKMLRLPAMLAWRHEQRGEFIRLMNYTAVYVGAQRSVSALLRSSTLTGTHAALLVPIFRSIMSTNLMFGFLDAIGDIQDGSLKADNLLSRFYISLSREQDSELAEHLATVWQLPVAGRSTLAVRAYLTDRLNVIGTAISLVRPGFEDKLAAFMENRPFFQLQIENVIKGFIEIANQVICDRERRWCISFDEIEILDEGVQTELFGCMRSIDQRAILKLAASPFSNISSEVFASTRPEGGNDFIPLVLSHARKKDAMRFSNSLFQALLTEHNLKDVTPDDVLGKSQLVETYGIEHNSPYRPPNGRNYRRLAELRSKDPSFAKYLQTRGINLETIWNAPENDRAGEARKFIQIAGLRLEYGRNNLLNKGDNEILRFRSRKRIPDFYLGSEALLTLCEGNPRFLIGLLRPLIARFARDRRRIPGTVQSDQVTVTVARYLSLLSALRISRNSKEAGATSLLSILDTIGDYFFEDTLGGDFKPEPITTFVVDRKVPRHVVDAVGIALNQGALVFIPGKRDEYVLGDVHGKRYRLSYLLATRYHLPLTYGGQVNLSVVVQDQKKRQAVTFTDLFSRISHEQG